ncbi:prephenate dehydratase [Tumebacillus sp. BK434]|uniref:prephenate dehydratase n=1 Tax=Tumebacillus sp. BK434 TaxID=2512169 RepID=UPI0010488BEA|nr:prephenate dehydratase [Tumebacillus sp. BK434]TCP54611.1 prephenate dehydratase [Tumebacillus sp. BK434]
MQQIVAYLGPAGTFTEVAAHHFFAGQTARFDPYPAISTVLDAVSEGRADYAVVPIENSIEGSVTMTMDWLIHQVDLTLKAELTLPIAQQLVSAARRELPDIKKVYSHPQAVAQCRLFLHQHLPHAEIEYTSSTAAAVKSMMSQPDQPWAAIGTRLARTLYRAEFLREDIQDHDHNQTRFVLVGTADMPLLRLPQAEQPKTTYVIRLQSDYPGALHRVLSAFASRQLNLTKIESRPTKNELGSYYFILDVERYASDEELAAAVAEIERLGCAVRCFGSYPAYRQEATQVPVKKGAR